MQGYFHAGRDRGLPFGPPPPPPFGMMYPPAPRVRGYGGSFHYDGPRGFGPPSRPNMYIRHGGMRGYGGRHMDGPRPRHYRDQSHSFGPPPIHNNFDPRRAGPMMSRDSPSISDLVQQASSADGKLLPFLLWCSLSGNTAGKYRIEMPHGKCKGLAKSLDCQRKISSGKTVYCYFMLGAADWIGSTLVQRHLWHLNVCTHLNDRDNS